MALTFAARALAAAACCALSSSIGINLGNVLEAPTEGAWAPVAQEYYFADYKARGFDFVRIPVRWDEHTAKQAPFAIDATFLARVHTIVGWSVAQQLPCLINSHHDDWIDDAAGFEAALPRFKAIWTQVAASFASVPADALAFEVYNELHVLNVSQANTLFKAVVPIMRASGGVNAVRPIYLGGLSWMSPVWLNNNPDAIIFPPLADGSRDPNLRMEIHSYDPYSFCLEEPPSQKALGPADYAAVEGLYTNASLWSKAHFNTQMLMGEAGCQVTAPSRADRLTWYKTIAAAAAAINNHVAIWDDMGTWMIYDRTARTWDEGVMSALGL